MSTLILGSAGSVALLITIKASALQAVTAAVQWVFFRQASAATRHLVWTLAISCMLLLPVVSVVLPAWPMVIRTEPHASTTAAIVTYADRAPEPASSPAPLTIEAEAAPAAPHAPGASWPAVLMAVYAAGVTCMLVHLMLQLWTVRRSARRATVVPEDEWTGLLAEASDRMGFHHPVRLLRSRERTLPMAFGVFRPSIMIPATADTWTDDRRRAVILHELAHMARHDCLTQMLAFCACALYWFHPGVWWVARRLRVERELACDDTVIAAGTEGRAYAGHLLEIAYSAGIHRAPALAVSMARPRQLEGRLLAALDPRRNRRVPAFRVRLAGMAIAAGLLVILASARPTVVAAETNLTRAPIPSAQMDSPQQAPAPAVGLDVATRPFMDWARRVVRAAVARFGYAGYGLPGTWEIRPSSENGFVHLRLAELNSSWGSDVAIDHLEGLTSAMLTGAGGPVQFRLRRDAGTLMFEGVIRNGVGGGTFSFTPDPNFPAELEKRGFTRPTSDEQYQLARQDIGFAFLDELNRQGYTKPQTSDLVRAGQHGVNTVYLRDMGTLGYRLGSLDPLVTLRDHGITPAYVRELSELGYKGLAADALRQARDHGITPDYVRGMRQAGRGAPPMDALINARDHGITPEYIRQLGDAGYRNLTLDQLIRVRDHGITPDYVRDMRQLGFSAPIDDLVQARDHGVSVEYVRGLAALGYGGLPMNSLIRLRDHGVTPEYAQDLKALGYDRIAVDDLVTLRDHGMTPERIREANRRAGTRLPIDLLKSLAAGGLR